MPPKLEYRQATEVPPTHAVQRRVPTIQTSGIFTLPLELFLEIFAYFADHRRFIRENYCGRQLYVDIDRTHAERLIAIRRLTMTCWTLRNKLLPFLWANAEGCISYTHYDYVTRKGGSGWNLYAQCGYLSQNREIAAYVQTFSVSLYFLHAPRGLMEIFIYCLVRLPNLKTLDILDASPQASISEALRRKNVIFPSIRELRITQACHRFIRSCPKLEDVTFVTGLDAHAGATIRSHGKGLKRIAGVDVYSRGSLEAVSLGCPNLREIGIIGSTRSNKESIKLLRQLKHLAFIEADLDEATDCKPLQAEEVQEKARKVWKRELIDLLKDSPSTDRKVLRWKIVQSYPHCLRAGRAHDVIETEELEVSPETSL